MDIANLGLAFVVVSGLALLTLCFALLIGKWIDAQSNTVVDKPRDTRKKGKS